MDTTGNNQPAPTAPPKAVRRKTAATPSRPRGRPTTQDSAEIDNVLLAAALKEFIREGYAGASMRSIAKAAGVARTTLQVRFDSKEALFKAILTQQISRMAAITSLGSHSSPDLSAGLKAYANRALSFSLEGDLLDVNRLVYGAAHQFPEVAKAAMASTSVGIAQITDFIVRCAEADEVPCTRPDVPAECFILLLRGWYGYAFLRGDPVPAQEREAWVDNMVDMLVAGRSAW